MKDRSFKGIVVAGRGLGVEGMSSPTMQRMIRKLTALDIVPGTLNVRLPRPFDTILERYVRWEDFGRSDPDPEVPGRKGLRYGEVIIAGRYRGFVFQGDEPDYPANQVELISDRQLRQALGLSDGDAIQFTIFSTEASGGTEG